MNDEEKLVVGKIYRNSGQSGTQYQYLGDGWFISVMSSWKLKAHGIHLRDSLTVDWDYSTNGYFDKDYDI